MGAPQYGNSWLVTYHHVFGATHGIFVGAYQKVAIRNSSTRWAGHRITAGAYIEYPGRG